MSIAQGTRRTTIDTKFPANGDDHERIELKHDLVANGADRAMRSDKFTGLGLTFDDVLLVPAASDVVPNEVSTRTRITRDIKQSGVEETQDSLPNRPVMAEAALQSDIFLHEGIE